VSGTPGAHPAGAPNLLEHRALVHAPVGKDGRLLAQALTQAGIDNVVCHGARDVIAELLAGASALIIADEALEQTFLHLLIPYLKAQPSWSDLPVLVLSGRKPGSADMRDYFHQLGNVTLLERPLQSVTLISATNSALRARKRQYEMREIDRRKDEFLAMLAHELRNPLAPVNAAAELLKMPNFDRNRVAQTSNIILRQVKHMSGLIDDLLDVSRVSRGLITLDLATLDARQVVANAVEQVQPLIDARRHRLAIDLGAEPALVQADQKRLVQIIANLLNNAAKYTPEGGDIALALAVEPDVIELVVTDTGIGMTAQVMTNVFDMFAQGERTPDRSQGGLGIGLALVRNLVQLHGGSVSAASDGSGRGSRFTLRLPRVHALPGPSHRVGADTAAPGGASRRLLIVDDNVDAAETLGMFLEASGYTTTVVHDARAAIASVRTAQPDACLLDIGLPDMSGTELAVVLRAMPGMGHKLLVAITGYGQQDDVRKALGAGFDQHMVKPVDMDKLLVLLAQRGGAQT
jgi:signal transduction histidine kinase/ActR/RegA family two-component response regulator